MSPALSLQPVIAAVVGVLLVWCAEVSSSQVTLTVGDDAWYNNNEDVLQQSMKLVDKLRQQIVEQEPPQLPRAYSAADKNRCELDMIESCIPLLVQQRVDGSGFFHRSWNEFKRGFKDGKGNYWIGNELLHKLTKHGRYKLRFDLQVDRGNYWYWAEYNTFIVFSESSQYECLAGKHVGNIYDAFRYSSEMKFSTYDRPNDGRTNCAKKCGGGFWYGGSRCSLSPVNARQASDCGFIWQYNSGYSYRLKKSRMWLLCR